MKTQIREINLTKPERKVADRLRIILFKAEGFTHHRIVELRQVSICSFCLAGS